MRLQISYQAKAVMELIYKVLHPSQRLRGTTHYARASQLVSQVLRNTRDQLEEIYYSYILQPQLRQEQRAATVLPAIAVLQAILATPAGAAAATALSRDAGSGALCLE
jgi:hypothetical protein